MTQTITRSYQEETIRSADSLDLVIMLHDMLIEDLRRSIAALQADDVEARTQELAHALSVLDQLQRGIDQQRGGPAAENMDRLYTLARTELLNGQLNREIGIFEKQLAIFSSLRDAWVQVKGERRQRPTKVDYAIDSVSPRDWTV
jgi:flagellar biosynthetic protein FliS